VERTVIEPGSRLLLYTDGLAEAFKDDEGGHMEFGRNGLEGALRSSRSYPLELSMQRLFDASNSFTAGEGRHDDTSVVLLERLRG
jgi:serine phosphatase RsbU (regulator of sigma subunit)